MRTGVENKLHGRSRSSPVYAQSLAKEMISLSFHLIIESGLE